MSRPDVAAESPVEVRGWGWHLLRVSSWLLVVLLPVHLVSVWLWHDPATLGVARFVERWHSTTWRLVDWTFFVLALLHGGLGLYQPVATRASDVRVRVAVAVALVVVLGGVALTLTDTIFRFQAT